MSKSKLNRAEVFAKYASDGWSGDAVAMDERSFNAALDDLFGHECLQFDCDGMCDAPQNHVVMPQQMNRGEFLEQALLSSRDLLIAVQGELGFITSHQGYSTKMSKSELKVAEGIRSINSILAAASVAGGPTSCPKCRSSIDADCWNNGDPFLACRSLHQFPILTIDDFRQFFPSMAGSAPPVASPQPAGIIVGPSGEKLVKTGDFRCPNRGEWLLWGNGEPRIASGDYNHKRDILRLATAEEIERAGKGDGKP